MSALTRREFALDCFVRGTSLKNRRFARTVGASTDSFSHQTAHELMEDMSLRVKTRYNHERVRSERGNMGTGADESDSPKGPRFR
jgi:hypothetical protein